MLAVSRDSQERGREPLGIATMDNCGETTFDRAAAKAKEPGPHKSGIVEVHVVGEGDIVNHHLGVCTWCTLCTWYRYNSFDCTVGYLVQQL